MSSKWPAKLFSYSPRMPVPTESETEASAADASQAAENAITAAEAEIIAPVGNEAALVERARVEPEAFGQLYELYVDRVYSYIYHRVGNVQEAEDLTARTFYRALEKLDTYEDRGLPFSAWLFRIAHNLVANWHRDQSRRPVVSLDEAYSGPPQHPEAAAEHAEEEDAMLEAIRTLPDDRQKLLLFKFSEGMSNLEIAAILGRTEGAVKSLYHRTLLSLREEMERRGWGK